jgi:hypothetical protein
VEHFVVARHDDHGAELETFGEVHCLDADVAELNLDSVVELASREAGGSNGRRGTRHLGRRSNEHSDLVRQEAAFDQSPQPVPDQSARFKSWPARRRAPYDSGLMVELVPRFGIESHEPVVNARESLTYAFREYELAGGTK